MKSTLQDQLNMTWREENPNYLIIIKNKAGKEMDFSKFTTVPTNEEVELPRKPIRIIEHVITYVNKSGLRGEMSIILVKNNLTKVIVGRIEIKNSGDVERDGRRFKSYLTNFKTTYRGNIVGEDITVDVVNISNIQE